MFPAPKPEPGGATGEISTSAAGVPPCRLPAAVTYLPGPPGRAISEVISVTGATPKDRHKTSRRRSPVMPGGQRCGVTQPQARQPGKGTRGKAWFNREWHPPGRWQQLPR
jgi:hypothetical protein